MIRFILLLFVCLYSITTQASVQCNLETVRILHSNDIAYTEVINNIYEYKNKDCINIANVVTRLSKTGLFDYVNIIRCNDKLFLILKKKPIISNIICVGNSKISHMLIFKACLDDHIQMHHIFNIQSIEKLKYRIIRLYEDIGMSGIQIIFKYQFLKPNFIFLKIYIQERIPTTIKNINIFGNSHFSSKKLIALFDSAPTFFEKYIFNHRKYCYRDLKNDFKKVKNFYYQHGYINFYIKDVILSSTNCKNSIDINIFISEGDKFNLSSFSLVGQTDDYINIFKKLLSNLKFQKKYDIFQIFQLQKELKQTFLNLGFLDFQAYYKSVFVKNRRNVDLVCYIKFGPRFIVHSVKIHSNHINKVKVFDDIIKQIKIGSFVNLNLIKDVQAKLKKTGYVKNVNILINIQSENLHELNIVYDITHKNARNLGVNIGYDILNGPDIKFNLQHKNWIGCGITSTIKIFHNNYKNYCDVYLTYPSILKAIILSNHIFYHSKNDFSKSFFQQKKIIFGIEGSAKFLLSKVNTVVLSFKNFQKNFVNKNYYVFNNNNKSDLIFTYSWLYNDIAKMNFPINGKKCSINLNILYPKFSSHVNKQSVSLEQYIPMSKNSQYILHTNINVMFGCIFGKQTYPYNENFYMAGNNNVRGFIENTIGPKSDDIKISPSQPYGFHESIGGNSLFISKISMIIPNFFDLGYDYHDIFRTSLFIDIGNVWNTNWKNSLQNIIKNTRNHNNINDIHASTGWSILWNSPIGCIEFSYAYPILYNYKDFLECFQIHIHHDW